MKLISAAIFSFDIALLALALGLEGPAFLTPDPAESEAEASPEVEAPVVSPPQSLDAHAREALDTARRQLAAALQARTEAEAARDVARAHVAAARDAFEAAMLELTEAEFTAETVSGQAKSRRAKATARNLKVAREAAVGAEARLREARQMLDQAEAAYDQSEASMSQARASLQAVTASLYVTPAIFEAV